MLKFKISSILAKVGLRKDQTLYYAQQQGGSRLPFEVLCRRIETATALSAADVMSCLHALAKVFEEELLQGKTVELPPIGSFRLVAGGKRMNSEKDVTIHTIGKVRVRFSPSKRLAEVATRVPLSIMRVETGKDGPSVPSGGTTSGSGGASSSDSDSGGGRF